MLLISRCYHQGIITRGAEFGEPRAAVLKLRVALDKRLEPAPSRTSLNRTEKLLANLWTSRKVTKRAHSGRGPEDK